MALGVVLERGLTYLQQSMCHENMDVIVVSVQSSNARKARAYAFKNREVDDRRVTDIQRVDSTQVIDGVTN